MSVIQFIQPIREHTKHFVHLQITNGDSWEYKGFSTYFHNSYAATEDLDARCGNEKDRRLLQIHILMRTVSNVCVGTTTELTKGQSDKLTNVM